MATQPLPSRSPIWSAGLQIILLALALYGCVSLPSLLGRWGLNAMGLGVFALWLALAMAAWPLLRARPARGHALLLGLCVVALRLCFAEMAAGRTSPGDLEAYLILARQLIEGRGLYIDEHYMGVRAFAFYPPAYPLLLAAWGAVLGLSIWSVALLGAFTDMAIAGLIVRIGERAGNAGAGRAAAFLYLIWPSVLFASPLAAKEGMCTALVLAIALVWLMRADGALKGWRGAVALGLPTGVLALSQPGWAPVAALFGIVLIGRMGWQSVLRFGVPAAAVAVVVMLPWWVRNWIVLDAFVPLTSAGGISLWIGNNADATGNWMPQPASLHGLPELEYQRRASAMAVAWITGHPLDWVRLTLTKFVRAVGVGQFGLVRLAAMYPPISAMLAATSFPLAHGSHLLLLGGSGAASRMLRSTGVATTGLLALACLLQVGLFGVWFEFGERHRDLMTPFLLLLICCAASGWRGRAKMIELRLGRVAAVQ